LASLELVGDVCRRVVNSRDGVPVGLLQARAGILRRHQFLVADVGAGEQGGRRIETTG
jgi:hypothetical protein